MQLTGEMTIDGDRDGLLTAVVRCTLVSFVVIRPTKLFVVVIHAACQLLAQKANFNGAG